MSTLGAYQVGFEISPIILVGGVAGTGMLPIVNVLSSQNYNLGILSTAQQSTLDNFFGHFRVLPGHTLMDNEVATYPVANQTVAANAVITDPLRLAVEMLVPANDKITVFNKLALMTQLKATLDKHTALGGWYNVATPSYIYQGCLLTGLTDGTDAEEGSQVQVRWVWSFIQPLLTVAAAQAAQNQAMAKITKSTKNSGDPPGSTPLSSDLGQPSSNIVQNVVPSASSPIGSNVAPSSINNGSVTVQSVSPIVPGN